jgi:hypothetical protein
VRAEFGSGWQISTDSLLGGKSAATMKIVAGGATDRAARSKRRA